MDGTLFIERHILNMTFKQVSKILLTWVLIAF